MVKNNVQIGLEHKVENESKPFNPYNVFGRLKKSADYNRLYEKSYKKYLKNINKRSYKKFLSNIK